MLRVNNDKSVDELELLAYAAGNLDKERSGANTDEISKLVEDERREKLEKIRIEKKLKQLELDREQQKVISRTRFLAELVSRLIAAKTSAMSIGINKAVDLIVAVGGDLKKTGVFTELHNAYIEDAFNELVSFPEIGVEVVIDPTEDLNNDESVLK